MKQYKHFISLGFFCSVALDLGELGLRSTSSPFDWCISEFPGVLLAIESNFQDFLKYENLFQNKKAHQQYRDNKYQITFFHDFDKYKSLEEQILDIQEKYARRINRFYQNISEPTLFIRYIKDDSFLGDGISELQWIEQNYDKIKMLLKSFNPNNNIIFIANEGNTSDKIKLYSVEKDKDDIVARMPLKKNEELKNYLLQLECLEKEKNKLIFKQNYRKRKNIVYRVLKLGKKLTYGVIKKEYVHDKQY